MARVKSSGIPDGTGLKHAWNRVWRAGVSLTFTNLLKTLVIGEIHHCSRGMAYVFV